MNRRALIGVVGTVLGGSGLAAATEANVLRHVSAPDDDDEEGDDDVSKSEVSLSEAEAKDVATDEVSGTVREVELEREDGTPVYEVTVETSSGTHKAVVVDANEGTVLAVETDD